MLGILIFFVGLYYVFWDLKFGFSLVFFALITNGFQVVPVSFMTLPEVGITKSYDLGLVLLVLYIIAQQKKCLKVFFWEDFKLVRYLFYFVLIDVVVSLFVYKYAPGTVIRVFRSYLFLLCYLLFSAYDIKQLNKLMIILVWITFVQSLLYDLQNVVGTELLNEGLDEASTVSEANAGGLMRFYNVPVFLLAAYAYLMVFRNQFSKTAWWLLVLTFASVLLLSLHRSLLISFLLVTLLSYLRNLNKYQRGILVAFTAVMLVISINILPERMANGVDNLASLGNLSMDKGYVNANYTPSMGENTTMYRAFHFLERFQYVLESPIRVFFGIGFLTEDAPQASQLNFIVGIQKDDDPGSVNQIDTGDITWSRLILQLGLIGSFLYMYMIVFYMVLFFKKSKNNDFAFAGAIFLLAELLISFFGTDLASPYTRTFLCLFLMCYIKYEDYRKEQQLDLSPEIQ